MTLRALLHWAAALAVLACAPALHEEQLADVHRDAAVSAKTPPAASPLLVHGAAGPGDACRRRHPGVGAVRLDERRSSGAVVLAKSSAGTIAYVADADANALHTASIDKPRMLATTRLPGQPAHVLVLADGRVAVTLRDADRVMLLEPRSRASSPLVGLCEVQVPSAPFALAATPDDATLLVTGVGSLAGYDTSTLASRFDVTLPRDPREVEVSGTKAFVAHVIGRISVVDLSAPHAVRTIDLRLPRSTRSENATALSESSQGFALARSIDQALPRERLFAPHVDVEPELMTAYYAQGFETPVATAIDIADERLLLQGPVALAKARRIGPGRCLLPRAAEASRSGAVYVTCLGNDMLVELDGRAADAARLPLRRWSVPAGPLGLAIDDAARRAVVWSQFDRRLSVISLESGVDVVVDAPAITDALPPVVAYGRQLFHKTDDDRITRDGRACASCHPDGRDDGLVWPTRAGMRQTISLAGRLSNCAPYGWEGEDASVPQHVLRTAERLGGAGLKLGEAEAIAAYLEYLPMSKSAPAAPDILASGREIFFGKRAGCSGCHIEGGTDGLRHDVATGEKLDTPSLHGVASSAPYLHDGRYATLDALLSSRAMRMGHTQHLAHIDRAALVAFLESL